MARPSPQVTRACAGARFRTVRGSPTWGEGACASGTLEFLRRRRARWYALGVRFLMLILATVAIAVPLRWMAAASCGTCIDGTSAAAVSFGPRGAEAVDCCGRAIASMSSPDDGEGSLPDRPEPNEGSKPSPCDDCGCPLRCCFGSLSSPLHVPLAVAIESAGVTGTRVGSGARSEPAAPNLLGLKRPPRLSAAT